MKTIVKSVHVSELPRRLLGGRTDGFVNLTIEDIEEPSDAQKLSYLRAQIADGDRAVKEGRVSPVDEVFDRLRSAPLGRHPS